MLKMFNKEKKVDKVLERIDTQIENLSERARSVDDLRELMELKKKRLELDEVKKSDKISADTKLIVAAQLFALVFTLKFEKIGVHTSKAIQLASKIVGRV